MKVYLASTALEFSPLNFLGILFFRFVSLWLWKSSLSRYYWHFSNWFSVFCFYQGSSAALVFTFFVFLWWSVYKPEVSCYDIVTSMRICPINYVFFWHSFSLEIKFCLWKWDLHCNVSPTFIVKLYCLVDFIHKTLDIT